jgi:hypothetical protein
MAQQGERMAYKKTEAFLEMPWRWKLLTADCGEARLRN